MASNRRHFDTASYQQFDSGHFLTRNMMKWFRDNYTTDAAKRHEIYASPLRATAAQLKGLPPALVQTAELDVLRDEGEAYARAMDAAGVAVTATRYNGMIHDYGLLNPLATVHDVRLETVGGSGVDYHYNNKLDVIKGSYDKVLLQSYSTLDAAHPGDPTTLIKYSGLLAQYFHDLNPNVDIKLTSTWSRADLTYKTASPWLGQPITQMALDVRAGYNAADAASDYISGVIPVGQTWNRAIEGGLADGNPYDGIKAGQLNLWAPDNYHASYFGYYLEALTIFGSVTGLDPRSLGGADTVARDLGIDSTTAMAMQSYASQQLAAEVPEPGTPLMFLTAGTMLFLARRRPVAGKPAKI